jgi:hypothetical protein
MMALTLIIIGAMSQSVNSYYRPIVEGETGYSNTTGDHPWGGDGSTTGGSDVPSRTTSFVAPTTGFGPVDLFLKIYYSRIVKYDASIRTGRSFGSKTTPVTPTTESTSTTNTGTVKTGNE